jgi:hypothetical protein
MRSNSSSPPAQRLRLQVAAAGVAGAAQQDQALAVVAQVGLDRVEAHEGRQRHRVGLVALEGLARVLLGGAADVAALGVQDHRHPGATRRMWAISRSSWSSARCAAK